MKQDYRFKFRFRISTCFQICSFPDSSSCSWRRAYKSRVCHTRKGRDWGGGGDFEILLNLLRKLGGGGGDVAIIKD